MTDETGGVGGAPSGRPYRTEQEQFWAGAFGDAYGERNAGADLIANNIAFFARAMARARGVESVLELGANRGLNLVALRSLLPRTRYSALEINPQACEEMRRLGFIEVEEGSLLEGKARGPADLVLIKGVLIHIAPDALPAAYDAAYRSAARFILLAEYYNPTPVTVSYRGHADRLFKRDFAGELLDRHRELTLLDYGFVYHRDPVFSQDDLTWFLLEKAQARG